MSMWRGGLLGAQTRPIALQGMFGPDIYPVSSQEDAIAALGLIAERDTPGALVLVADQAWDRTLTIPRAGVTVESLGQRTVTLRNFTAAYPAVFDVSVDDFTLRGLNFELAPAATNPDALVLIDGADGLRMQDIDAEVSGAALLETAAGGASTSDIKVTNCSMLQKIEVDASRMIVSGCYLSRVVITDGRDNVINGNVIITSADDSASAGGNIASNNVGGASYTNWTGSGSTAVNNL